MNSVWKLRLLAPLFAAGLLATVVRTGAQDTDIVPGDSVERVISILGEPGGRLKRGNYEVLMYQRGTVTCSSGVVSSISFVSARQAAEEQARRDRAAAVRREAEERARSTRIAQGTAEKQARLGDRAFRALSLKEQLAYWEQFRAAYPEVAVEAEITALKREIAKTEGPPAEKAAVQTQIAEAEKMLQDVEVKIKEARTNAILKTHMRERTELQAKLDGLRAKLAELEKATPAS